MRMNSVARSACNRRDDRNVLPRQSVEQTGLAHIRAACQHHVQPGPQQAALPRVGEHRGELRAHPVKPALRIGLLQEVDLFFRKVERRLHQHAQRDELVDECMDCPREVTFE